MSEVSHALGQSLLEGESGYPYLRAARELGLPYGDVLRYTDAVEATNTIYREYGTVMCESSQRSVYDHDGIMTLHDGFTAEQRERLWTTVRVELSRRQRVNNELSNMQR